MYSFNRNGPEDLLQRASRKYVHTSNIQPCMKAITIGTDPGSPASRGNPEPFDQAGSVSALGTYLNPAFYGNPLSEA